MRSPLREYLASDRSIVNPRTMIPLATQLLGLAV
jgi:hypothetical protein